MKKELTSFIALNKRFLLPVALFVSSFFMLFFIIIPQISSISETLAMISKQKDEVSILSSALVTITSQPDNQLEENFQTATNAIPTEKKIAMIFSALTAAAQKSNTTLEEFSLTVGGVYGRAALVATSVAGTPSVGVAVKVGGSDAASLVDFAHEIQQTLPLSEVSKVTIGADSGSFEIGFFYKPFDTNKIQKQDKVAPLTQSDTNLLNQLKQWEQ